MGSRLAAVAGAALALSVGACTNTRLTQFESVLAAHASATVALTEWCAARHLADPARIVATPVPASAVPKHGLGGFIERRDSAALRYRHVRLSCGGKVLSEAHNWYDPALLTPAMNDALDHTDTPFGKVVAPLEFKRFALPLESKRGRGDGCPRGTILTHRAWLQLPDGKPLALVIECYTPANLGR